eukprot:scaffold10478_cov114-Isochrysis_galbana.AAC.5
MPVVPPLSNRQDGDQPVFRRVALRVVRAGAPQVRPRIDHPSAMQHPDVAQAARHEEAVPEGLTPRKLRHQTRHEETPEKVPPGVVLVLKHHERVFLEVVDVDLAASLGHARVLLHV